MYNQQLFEQACIAIQDGLSAVANLEKNNEYIPSYHDFPILNYFDSGLPRFSTVNFFGSASELVKDYGASLAPRNGKSDKWPDSWMVFREKALGDPRFSEYFKLRDSDIVSDNERNSENIFRTVDMIEWSRDYHTRHVLGNLLDRYIHLTKSREFEIESFRPIYEEWERSVYLPDLPIEIWIPIVCQSFNFERIKLSEEFSLVKMSEELQLARCKAKDLLTSHSPTVAGAATHALVIKGWSVPNEDNGALKSVLFEILAFKDALDKADRCLASLRIATGKEFGYSHVVILPKSWAESWTAHLPSVYTFITRRYQDRLENYGWLRKPIPVSRTEAEEARAIIAASGETSGKNIILAERRLNQALLRNTEEDAILDITIGLESMLVGDANTEITHRLSLRLAALQRLEKHPDFTPSKLFQACKQVYKFRSSVVHGTSKANKNRDIRISESESIPAIDVGLNLLRYTLKTLILHKDYQNPAKIDELLMGYDD